MDDREIRRRSSVDRRNAMDYNRRIWRRSESPQPENSRNRYDRNGSPPRRSHHEYRTPERREHRTSREHHNRRYNEQENPEESRCLGVFGMSLNTREEDIRDVFEQYGPIDKIKIIYDMKTNQSRGFSFIYYESIENARRARQYCNNLEINGKIIRVDFSLTKRAHSPTPGIYMGNRRFYDSERDRRPGGGNSRYDTEYRRDSYRRNEGRTQSRYHSRSRSPRR